ncbi:MAG: sugar phosphate nucleotidyltransferase [Chitinophagaceae bacterium]|nr:sugar phosphate nucleotidyltransferase [Chitinophagaceae bacterium]
MKPTLLILAAGMASRYGSMKQIQAFGPGGETIMDYSIYDAIRAGFGKVVFIIRKEFAKDFQDIFEPKLKGKIATDYVFQELNSHLNGFSVPAERTKPWGTAHAVLCAKDAVKEPFAVINADDFYGSDAFVKAFNFLTRDCNEKTYSIIGYELLKTLSDNGTVNRGVCRVNGHGNLASIAERLNISKQNGKIVCDDSAEPKELPLDSQVSMNFWCFDPSVFPYSQKLFHEFVAKNISNPKAEFFIPIVADQFIHNGGGAIKVIPTSALWFGVTYKEDAPDVKASIENLVAHGEYPPKLW